MFTPFRMNIIMKHTFVAALFRFITCGASKDDTIFDIDIME